MEVKEHLTCYYIRGNIPIFTEEFYKKLIKKNKEDEFVNMVINLFPKNYTPTKKELYQVLWDKRNLIYSALNLDED